MDSDTTHPMRQKQNTHAQDSHTEHPACRTFSAFTRPACSPFLSIPWRSTSFSSSAKRRRCPLATAHNSTHAAAQPQAIVVAAVGCFAASTIQGCAEMPRSRNTITTISRERACWQECWVRLPPTLLTVRLLLRHERVTFMF